MDKQAPTRPDNLPYAKAWPASEKRGAPGLDFLGDLARQPPASPVSGRTGPGRPAPFLIWGLISLQILALVAALLVLVVPPEPQEAHQDIMAALEVAPTIEAVPVLLEPPPAHPQSPIPNPQSPTQPEPPALSIRGLEITQGIQVFNEPQNPRCQPDPHHPDFIFCNNSIPLVAGRHTLVRVYLACNDQGTNLQSPISNCPTTESVVRLRLLKEGQELANLTRQLPAETLPRINNLPFVELRANLDNSINFEFFPPPPWLTGQITFEVEAGPNPQNATAAPPASLTLSKNFAIRKPLRVAYLPIEYQGLSPPEPTGVDHWLLRMYPVPAVEYYRLPVPDLIWPGELSKSEILRQLLYTYWLYAQYYPDQLWPDQLFGWLPQEFYNGGASDPFWCPNCAGPHSSRVAFGGLRPEQDIGGPRILVHEIAHNLGAQHAWSPTQHEDAHCFKAEGADIRVDPDWPYAQTPYIQEFGLDLYSTPPVIYAPSFYDMMAYCTHPWISPHTYRKLFDSPFLQPDATATLPLADFKPQAEISNGGTLLVSGVVYADGTVSHPEIIHLTGDALTGPDGAFNPPLEFIPPTPNPQSSTPNPQSPISNLQSPTGHNYCLEILATDNTTLAQHCFEAGFLDLETGLPTESSPFFFTLPTTEANDVAQVTIRKNKVALVTVTPSNSPPQVNLTFPNGGESLAGRQIITWEATDPDQPTNQPTNQLTNQLTNQPTNQLSYDLLYSPDAGQTWLPLAVRLSQPYYALYTDQIPPSQNGLMRVIANDGFHTGLDESDAPFVVEPPPENSLSLRSAAHRAASGPATLEPGQSFEVALLAHRLTEPGLFGLQFKLHFDPNLVQVDNLRLHPDLSLVLDESIDNDTGQVSVVASRQGQVPNLTGDLTLATFTFNLTAETGQLHLNLSQVKAGARGGLPLTITKIQDLSLPIAHPE